MRAWLAAVVLLCGCGKSAPGAGPDGGGSGSDAALGSDAGDGWTTLISRPWSLTAGTEKYECVKIRVLQDMWISGFRALSPLGTHHEVLTISTDPTHAGTNYDCTSGNLDTEMLYAAGLNTDDLAFPPGDAVHIPAGQYINLNLHLFDVSDNDESGQSGVLVRTIDPSQVVHEIDMTFSGTFNIDVPPGGMATNAYGGCQANQDIHVFALWPHMHQIGVHQKLTVTTNNVPTTLLDTDYSFSDQKNYPMEAVIPAGSQILTTCTYVNNTPAPIRFGDSSTAEMCFTGMYKYPVGAISASGAGDATFSCTSN